MFHFVMLMILQKKRRLAGTSNHSEQSHLHLMGNLMRLVRHDVSAEHPSDSSNTAVAISGLALIALQEGDLVATEIHMRAVQTLNERRAVSDAAWAYCYWMDILLAAIVGQRPYLPYRNPPFGEGISLHPEIHAKINSQALRNAKCLPQRGSVLSREAATNLLIDLHTLDHLAASRETLEEAPYALVYAVGHHLCSLSAELHEEGASPRSGLVMCGGQLAYWCAVRYWSPIDQVVMRNLVNRAVTLAAQPHSAAKPGTRESGLLAEIWSVTVAWAVSLWYEPGATPRPVSYTHLTLPTKRIV